MIRFLATDLDGTLLDGDRNLPAETFPLIAALYERGILFAPASGRQYANLKKLFAPVADKVIFICENGALVKYKEKTLRLVPIPDKLLKGVLDEIRSIPYLYPLLCGEHSAYIEDAAEPFRSISFEAYTNCVQVENLDTVVGKEEICKIAVYDMIDAAENCIKILPPRLTGLRTTLSGREWCDVSVPGADKGEAIRFLQGAFGFKKEECAAFGDHMNDYEMLAACGKAYVPENAYPPLKQLIGNAIPANTEGGVIAKMKEILSGKEL